MRAPETETEKNLLHPKPFLIRIYYCCCGILFSKEKPFCRTTMSYEYYEHDEEEEELEEDIFDDTSMFRVGWSI